MGDDDSLEPLSEFAQAALLRDLREAVAAVHQLRLVHPELVDKVLKALNLPGENAVADARLVLEAIITELQGEAPPESDERSPTARVLKWERGDE
ncbi:MAG TPA: hypothetical protein VN838_08930 [Bradyrhizobium sp.]|nr:hypothetical protein [Bradyrhizobium sp.]